jgi:cleavage and polyadenylation specificity factor subunit 1
LLDDHNAIPSSGADNSNCAISVKTPGISASSSERITSCTLYSDRGPEPWLRKARTDAWLSGGIADAIDGNDNSYHDQSDIYCIICYESGKLEIFDVPSFKSVFCVENFVSGAALLFDTRAHTSTKVTTTESQDSTKVAVKKDEANNVKIVELAMHRWSGQFSRPFLFGLLNNGTLLCYHAYCYDGLESNTQSFPTSPCASSDIGNDSDSRLRNLRFRRISSDITSQDDISILARSRITLFNNIAGYEGLFLSGPRPTWVMVCRQRFRVHPQVCKCNGILLLNTLSAHFTCNSSLLRFSPNYLSFSLPNTSLCLCPPPPLFISCAPHLFYLSLFPMPRAKTASNMGWRANLIQLL